MTPWQIMQTLRFKGTRDPFFANVGYLLHFDDIANPQAWPDVRGNVWSRVTNPTLIWLEVSSEQTKFGGGALRMKTATGTSSDFTLVASPIGGNYSLGTGNKFTLEGWMWWTGNIDSRPTWGMVLSNVGTEIIGIVMWTANQISFRTSLNGATRDDLVNPPLNQWVHMAVSYDGTTKYWFVNGVLAGSAVVTAGAAQTVQQYTVRGASSGGNPPYAYMDDLRFTFGICRYTANFSVPTEAFPNS